MKAAVLIRTTSVQSRSIPALGSPRSPASGDQFSGAGISFLRRSPSARLSRSPKASSLRFDAKERRGEMPSNFLRRARSEAYLIGSDRRIRIGRQSPVPSRVAEEEEEEVDLEARAGAAAAVVMTREEEEEEEEVEYSGGGMGKGRRIGGGRGGGGGGEGGRGGDGGENRRIGDYYQEMLRADPGNPLLLRNYGRFLYEVEGDVKGAEQHYGRAILASPGDGEVLSLYGKLVWETHRDGKRAGSYFERAVEASPDDCYVLASYAQFLWDAEEEEDEEGEGKIASSPPLVEAC